jgi:hypothetical protein
MLSQELLALPALGSGPDHILDTALGKDLHWDWDEHEREPPLCHIYHSFISLVERKFLASSWLNAFHVSS